MKHYFYELASAIDRLKQNDEVILSNFEGEESDFVRINHATIRQAGHVSQHELRLRLIRGPKQMSTSLVLMGLMSQDIEQCLAALDGMRQALPFIPDDPYLAFASEIRSSEHEPANELPPHQQLVGEILGSAHGTDLVGIYAGGSIYRGFANTLGQRNWFATDTFNFDFSLYLHQDKAVKSGLAGFSWKPHEWQRVFGKAKEELALLKHPAKTLQPGKYRVYLAPQALEEIVDIMGWGGFGIKAHHTKQSPLLKMHEEGLTLNPAVSLSEDIAEGLSPSFDDLGYLRPGRTPLIQQGKHAQHLVCARSAKEFGIKTNGANSRESPESLSMAPGSLPTAAALRELGTGILINNLWYLNYSDRNSCRMTGMTRFASFWVEAGKIMAPINVMRFDESIYRIFGPQLIALTKEAQFIPSASTYERRSTVSRRLPGALIDQFQFTL